MTFTENPDYTVFAIETSCDETAAAVVRGGRRVLSSAVHSQIGLHQRYGGVVPEVASRSHTDKINGVAAQALETAGLGIADVDAVAVTYGAGLQGPLLVGTSYAKAVAFAYKKPLIAVSHIRGHIAANYIAYPNLKPPFVCLVVSGGHTAFVQVDSYTRIRTLGGTADDAAGEAFDKVARVLGLGYPGGPQVEQAAKDGAPVIAFPSPGLKGYDVSYSGLKTSVINMLHAAKQRGEQISVPDICASFQEAATAVLAEKAVKACRAAGLKTLCAAGGVAANGALREKLKAECGKAGIALCLPPLSLCTDNAAMIGAEAYFSAMSGQGFADYTLNVQPYMTI